jgi:Fe-S oxidoreductase
LDSCAPIEKPIDKVAYFADTYANYNDHELGFAVLEVLVHNSIEVVLPRQRPTPLPAIVYGDVKTARRDLAYSVRHLAKAVRDGYRIVCSEPSAALCLQQELRHFVAGEDAKLVSDNTVELMSYLSRLFKEGKLRPIGQGEKERLLRRYAPRNDGGGGAPRNDHRRDAAGDDEVGGADDGAKGPSFAYHCPCHLSAIGGGDASIELLEKVCGVKVIDLKGGCCGLAGTFGMQKKNYELSSKISEPLAKALESAQIKNILTECSACKMQIEHISNCAVSHPIKILAQAYGR